MDDCGVASPDMLPPPAIVLTDDMLPPPVRGVVPRRGPLLHPPPMLYGVRQSPYGPQSSRVHRFPTPPKRYPYGTGGFY